jgi:hypothetical protein
MRLWTLRASTRIAIVLFLLSAIVLIPCVSASSSQPTKYWFQVGASATDPDATHVVGASVEINVRTEQPQKGPLSYWVGVDLPNDSFIQVGYLILHSPTPLWIWAYFPPGTAKKASDFLEEIGPATPLGWTKFTITKVNDAWLFYMNDKQIGQVYSPASDSGDHAPGAVAEVAGTTATSDQLGLVEFRNLAYQALDGKWHSVKLAEAYILDTLSSYGVANPYGVSFQLGRNNYWISGSNLPGNLTAAKAGEVLWPWIHADQIQVNAPYGHKVGKPSSGYQGGWYAYGTEIFVDVPEIHIVQKGERDVFSGWQLSDPSASNGPDMTYQGTRSGFFRVNGPLSITAAYEIQYQLSVNSALGNPQGSGWFNAGANASFQIQPTVMPRTGILGALGLCDRFTEWTGNYNGTDPQVMIVMDSPKTITAVWTTGLQMTILDWLLIIAIMAIAVGALVTRHALT